MEEKGVNKAELSKLAGVSKSNITQLLSGDHNMRLSTISDLLYALDSKLEVSTVSLGTESILETFTVATDDNWIPAKEFTVKESEYNELSELERTEQVSRAA